MLGQAAGTYRISEVLAAAPELAQTRKTVVDMAVGLLLVGAVTKSALIPLHFWLPAAMAAPTPVSAYLHAAAMVKAGIYLVARFAPGFAETACGSRRSRCWAWAPCSSAAGRRCSSTT